MAAWKPLTDLDLRDGTHTCWYTELPRHLWGVYGKYAYISECSGEKPYLVYVDPEGEGYTIDMMECKTLTSAKRWVSGQLMKHRVV